MSSGFIDMVSIRHYVIITDNFNIDIVTEWEPALKIDTI